MELLRLKMALGSGGWQVSAEGASARDFIAKIAA
jgi:hypothetical protein